MDLQQLRWAGRKLASAPSSRVGLTEGELLAVVITAAVFAFILLGVVFYKVAADSLPSKKKVQKTCPFRNDRPLSTAISFSVPGFADSC